jgi:hypothetical protein
VSPTVGVTCNYRVKLWLRRVANRLDIVPIRANHEGSIVVRVVNLPDARRTIVFATGSNGRLVERPDLLPILGDEGEGPSSGGLEYRYLG